MVDITAIEKFKIGDTVSYAYLRKKHNTFVSFYNEHNKKYPILIIDAAGFILLLSENEGNDSINDGKNVRITRMVLTEKIDARF